MNILYNAAKFSKNKPISIKLNRTKSNFVITIIDSGEGIEKQNLPHIFEGFYKGNQTFHEGIGLSLFYTQKIINAHHGTIKAKSKYRHGTKITVRLPTDKI